MELVFTPGDASGPPGPLARFLPPLEKGSTRRALEQLVQPGALLLDPFGGSPRLLLEAAQCGRAVLAGCNNPVTRFTIEHVLQPFSLEQLQAALARLAALPKNGGRLEPFLLELYQTQCSRCAELISAEYFVWDREQNLPILKSYACTHCNHTIEEPISPLDRQLAAQHSHRGLQHALALEQVAPPGDPDREHAEAALAVYPGRAVYAIVTLLNKLQQLAGDPLQIAAQALTLSALDEVNALWGHPEGRARPLQLVASPRFREANLWRALERAVGDWGLGEGSIPLQEWPEAGWPDPGTVALFPGPVRELAATLPAGEIERVLTVLPRPNQAFWTLSALWAGWLWGKESATSIKAALRRRRYDWGWHAGALRSAMWALAPQLAPGAELLVHMPDAEPGFLAAALSALDGAGFHLTGRAMRFAEGQALLTWRRGPDGPVPGVGETRPDQLRRSVTRGLQQRGEPAGFAFVHAAAWTDLAERRDLGARWERSGEPPIYALSEMLEGVLADRRAFRHYSKGMEPESGQYWLADDSDAQDSLADRVERIVLELLQAGQALETLEVEAAVCNRLPGLLTPDRRIILACLQSYGWVDERDGLWRLRPEDLPGAREPDCQEISQLLVDLAGRLGYHIRGGNPVLWWDPQSGESYLHYVEPTAQLGEAIRSSRRAARAAAMQPAGAARAESAPPAEPAREVIVVPGGRAALVAEKARQDPRLREWLQGPGQVIKFRHIRRLAAETTLDRSNFLERLAIDPPGQHDPQMPLL